MPRLEAEADLLKVSSLSAEEVVSEATDLYRRWPEIPVDHKRRVVESILEKVTIGNGEIELTLSCLPSSEELTKSQQALLGRLGSCHRTVIVTQPKNSPYMRRWKRYPDEANTLGAHLRRKRIDLGQSQVQLAATLGVTESAIYMWEKGKNRPSELHRSSIIRFLGFDPVPTP
ncbi:MAG: hypothetical protein A2583_02850 [Bdellovibrionales bacterium RIFOXYD1_FULL_53_11]|nr:MAG: hypothetical protein A2583_02850 [Bdellovibrionales bacterium RIFOXYD1_FULL_53_11]